MTPKVSYQAVGLLMVCGGKTTATKSWFIGVPELVNIWMKTVKVLLLVPDVTSTE
jgi:hypothetical protein